MCVFDHCPAGTLNCTQEPICGSSMCAAILSSFCLYPFTFSVFSHLFKLFLPSYSTTSWPFQSFFTFLNSFGPLTQKLFRLFRYPSFCLFNSFKHLTSCSVINMFNFFNSFSPLQLFCLFIFLKY